MLIAPPKGSYELKIYKEWLLRYNINHSILTSEIINIDQPLLLCGGADVGVNRVRDQLELNWIQSAIENRQPIIGICRGMQLLNIYFGGTVENLTEKVTESHRLDSFDGDDDHCERISQFHCVMDKDGNKLTVNSRHHQYCSKVADNFKVTYKSVCCGMIPEAFEDRTRKIWAVQWHPERFESDNNLYPLNMIYCETKH